jgi:hypothetical protein
VLVTSDQLDAHLGARLWLLDQSGINRDGTVSPWWSYRRGLLWLADGQSKFDTRGERGLLHHRSFVVAACAINGHFRFVAWMLGMGRIGGIAGAFGGGILLQLSFSLPQIISGLSGVGVLQRWLWSIRISLIDRAMPLEIRSAALLRTVCSHLGPWFAVSQRESGQISTKPVLRPSAEAVDQGESLDKVHRPSMRSPAEVKAIVVGQVHIYVLLRPDGCFAWLPSGRSRLSAVILS